MEIVILNRKKSGEYSPTKLTYAIRIRDFNDRKRLPKLMDSHLFQEVKIYRFDDADPDSHGRGPLKEGLAERIITDFQKLRNNCECLMIHCNQGESRSPAVGLALNDIFDLGYDHFAFSGYHWQYNPHVFKQLIFAADRMRLLSDKIKSCALEPLFLASCTGSSIC